VGSGATSGGAGGNSGTGSACSQNGGTITCGIDSNDNACIACAKRECCFELVCCAGDDACSGPTGEGELSCIQECVLAVGVANDATVTVCADQCSRGATIAPATNDILACLLNGMRSDGGSGDGCSIDCFP
jgi:hypothetical protein